MNYMRHEIRIARAPADVFAYATTPGKWPEWHPASLRLDPGADHPLKLGEQFEEDIKTAGRDDHLSWIVTECEAPGVWAARALARNNRAKIFIRYRFTADGNGTAFQRELEYELPNFLLRLLNALFLRQRIEVESKLSLQQLRQRLETTRS